MTRPTLILQPIHNSSSDILKTFAMGKPLSPEQRHYLEWHDKQLSSHEFDPILKYYIESYKKHYGQYQASFLLPHEVMNFEDVQRLKKRIALFLRENKGRLAIPFTQQQLVQFNDYTAQELIYWHGNQFLTGAPFIPGGIPPVIFFQWGNYFGIVKYCVLPGEKGLKANILVYFEDRDDRLIDECVKNYNDQFQIELLHQNQILMEHHIEPEAFDQFLIKAPTVSLHKF